MDEKRVTKTEEEELAGTEAPLIEHLKELRKRLIISLSAVGVLFLGCFYFADPIFTFLLGPFERAVGSIESVRLIYTAPQEFFFTKLSVALFAAIFFAAPIIVSQIYVFVAPGLYKRERGAFLPFLVATPALFLAGAALMYYGVLSLALGFFLSQETGGAGNATIDMLPRVSEYLSLIMTLVLAFGICFQLPVLLTLLAKVDLVGSDALRRWRKYAVVVVLVVAATLTPPDPISQLGLALPLMLLYEVSIISVKLVERSRRKAQAAAPTS